MLITCQKEADDIFNSLSKEETVGIDSEFQWNTTYAPIPALIQVGTDKEVHLIDPQAITDYTSLKNFLENPSCTKIFHSCSQDLILFKHMCNAVTTSIFDSQIAYAFLSTNHQISYGGLVENIMGKTLAKGSQRSNWLRRPLSPTQLEYAKNDVTWLYKCYFKLKTQLDSLHRNEWHKYECDEYSQPAFYHVPEPEHLYKKTRGIGRLNRDQLSIMREICAWREEVAKKVDLRPRRVISDDAMFSIAYKQPRNTQDLKKCRDMTDMALKHNSREIIHCVQAGLEIEDHLKPEPTERRTPSKEEEKVTDKLSQAVSRLAEKLNIATPLLLTRQSCKKIAACHFSGFALDLAFLSPWRRELLEDEIIEILNNK